MKIIECEQGSLDWLKARLGIPTASCFDKIVTAAGKESAASDGYLASLAAEWWLGQPCDDFQSGFMERGSLLEEEAVADYAFEVNAEPVKVGLCLTDDGRAGASPDRLVGTDGLWEIKVPSAAKHMAMVLGTPPKEYFVQVQGQLWVTGREWCELVCFHPTFPRVVRRYVRDEEFIESLAKHLGNFCDRLDAVKERFAGAKAEYDATREAAEWEAQASM